MIRSLLFGSLLFLNQAHALTTSFEEERSVPLVYLSVAIKSGYVTDPKGQGGLTNFLGEMLLRGTRVRSKEQIDQALDEMGASLGAEIRAESLIFRGAVLKTELERFEKLLLEILTQPSFPEGEIRKLKAEMTSAISEELSEDGRLAGRRFTKQLFRGHPYGNSALGTTAEVQGLTRAMMEKQYQSIFQASNVLVLGSGDSDRGAIESWARKLEELLPKSTVSPPPVVLAPVDVARTRVVLIDKPDRTQTQVFLGQIGVTLKDPAYFPLYLGNYAFGGGSFSSRLMVEIRVKRGWSYGASSAFRHGLKPRSWIAHLFPASKDTPAAVKETLNLVRRLRDDGITPEEFAFNQRSLINNDAFNFNTPKKRMENRLLELTLDLPDGFFRNFSASLEKVTLSDVNDQLKRFLKPEQLTVLVLGTAKTLKPALAKAFGLNEESIDVIPYTEE